MNTTLGHTPISLDGHSTVATSGQVTSLPAALCTWHPDMASRHVKNLRRSYAPGESNIIPQTTSYLAAMLNQEGTAHVYTVFCCIISAI
jgi:hypothetical protein